MWKRLNQHKKQVLSVDKERYLWAIFQDQLTVYVADLGSMHVYGVHNKIPKGTNVVS